MISAIVRAKKTIVAVTIAAVNHAIFRGSSLKLLLRSVVVAAVIVVVDGMMIVMSAVSESKPPSRAVAVIM